MGHECVESGPLHDTDPSKRVANTDRSSSAVLISVPSCTQEIFAPNVPGPVPKLQRQTPAGWRACGEILTASPQAYRYGGVRAPTERNRACRTMRGDEGHDRLAAEWMSVRQVTRYAAVSERTLRTWIHSPVNPLPAVRVCGKILVRRSDLDEWLERRRIKPLESVDVDDIVEDVLQRLVNGR